MTGPPQQSRRWLPAAILINNGNSNSTAASTTPSGPLSAADSSACQGWAAATAALGVTPALPAGWDWDTPGIDTRIVDQNAAVKAAIDLFETDITENDPPQVVAAARDYVAAQRHSMQQFADRAFTTADGVPVTTARVKLDHACGVN